MEIRLLAATNDPLVARFKTTLLAHCARLGITPRVRENTPLDLPAEQGLLILFLDPTSWHSSDAQLKAFLADGGTVIPVASTAPSTGPAMRNTCIEPINAFIKDRHGSDWDVALVDDV